MVKCAHCGAVILLGGSQEGTLRFCNATCLKKGATEILTQPPKFRLTKQFWTGLVTLMIGSGPLVAILLLFEAYFLTGLSIAVAITAIMGLVGAKRHPGNRKVIVWALVLTFLAVAGFIVWFLIALSRAKLFF